MTKKSIRLPFVLNVDQLPRIVLSSQHTQQKPHSTLFLKVGRHSPTRMESTNETDSNINLIPQQRSVTFSNPLGLQTLTKRQKLYLWLPQTIGAAILDGAINFAIATAMYRTSPTRVTMWILSENTLAGDMGVTT